MEEIKHNEHIVNQKIKFHIIRLKSIILMALLYFILGGKNKLSFSSRIYTNMFMPIKSLPLEL